MKVALMGDICIGKAHNAAELETDDLGGFRCLDIINAGFEENTR